MNVIHFMLYDSESERIGWTWLLLLFTDGQIQVHGAGTLVILFTLKE